MHAPRPMMQPWPSLSPAADDNQDGARDDEAEDEELALVLALEDEVEEEPVARCALANCRN